MSVSTKEAPGNNTTLGLKPTSVNIDSHAENIRKIVEKQAAKRDEMMRCLNPIYAAARESEKPLYKYRVTAEFYANGKDGFSTLTKSTQTVVAKSESDAWAMFCDRIRLYPSPHDAKTTFECLGQVKHKELAANIDSYEIPCVTIPEIRGFG